MSAVHASPYSGHWYPASVAELESLLDRAFTESQSRTGSYVDSGLLACVVPHAGPMYSGTVAAAAYRTLARRHPERVVLLGFSHRGGPRGIAWPDTHAIATPLGEMRIDREFLERLPFARVREDEVCDHSVEIQLPFLQRAVPGVPVAPLYAGLLNDGDRRAAAEALAAASTPGTVLVASSDFTHYGREFGFLPFPADSRAPGRIHELDHECIGAAGSLHSEVFLETLRRTGATVCGREPIALLLEFLRRRNFSVWQETLDYQASGEITGDWRHSVSYAALGYFPDAAFELDVAEQKALLGCAEAALDRLRATGRRQPSPAPGAGALESRRGVFVSLHQGERLLGCIGNCGGAQSLAEAVPELTLAAALDDPRFGPATRVEGEIEIEISVLSPMRLITGEEEFQVGRHGAHLSLGAHRGLLLPQVAKGRDWSAADFLEALAHKAGLGPRAWQKAEARLSVFEARVFSRRSLAEREASAAAPD
jgi:MEMO1 family protein